MREIKFRAWDEKNNTMHMPDGKLVDYIEWFAWRFPQNMMQYTGLKDEDGIEIYEGDILNDDINCCAWLVLFGKNGCFLAADPKNHNEFCFLDDYDFMVIGNIHENPELLEAK